MTDSEERYPHACAWCGLANPLEEFGEDDFYRWTHLPPEWLVSPGRDHDEPEVYACSREHATAYDTAQRLWREYERRGGYWPKARWRHIAAAAKMNAEFGADWVAKLLPEHRERFDERERDDYHHWKNGPERPKRGTMVKQFPEAPGIFRRDVCFCEWCLVEWIQGHDCPTRGLVLATSVSPGPFPELETVPIESSRYASWLAADA